MVAESLKNKRVSHFRDLREERRESIGTVFVGGEEGERATWAKEKEMEAFVYVSCK